MNPSQEWPQSPKCWPHILDGLVCCRPGYLNNGGLVATASTLRSDWNHAHSNASSCAAMCMRVQRCTWFTFQQHSSTACTLCASCTASRKTANVSSACVHREATVPAGKAANRSLARSTPHHQHKVAAIVPALILAETRQRYERAAEQATLAGLHPVWLPGVFGNASSCWSQLAAQHKST
uniref:Uncharacterized protein n=1 Tax=Haptolina ericina TaxID=156174 RepID=A0A7S3BMW7_9EUKA|mmetsp:Transcript_63604/g.141863  ORF Transcript_63604/g.141863 Transcript_63604/m.141863 type:complete len:180 (+) Transcript_63604:707-1246(+)